MEVKSRVVKVGNFWHGEVYGEWVRVKDGEPSHTWVGWKRITAKCVTRAKAEEDLAHRLLLKAKMERVQDGKK